jgi:hypothetical protein
MTLKEIEALIHANVGKRLRITLENGVVQSVDISSVDDEGFVHSGPNGDNPDGYWTRFEGVTLVECENSH